MRTGRMKRGFTLIETVVTVGIVAAMAAVVIPQVAKQFDTADPTRIQNDFKNLQTAIETFNINVQSLPGDLDDLVVKPLTTSADTSMSATGSAQAFSSVTGWKGPYVDISITDGTVDALHLTGYSATLLDSFVCYDTGNNTHGVSEGSDGAVGTDTYKCPGSVGQKFLALQIKGMTCLDTNTQFAALNALFDGTSEGANAETLGRVRCRTPADTPALASDIVYFLTIPLG
jgi:prepilin-type N-terminal cleavage/methylation domain-containing protein